MNTRIPLLAALASLGVSAAFDQIAPRLIMRGSANITSAPNIWWIVLIEASFVGFLLASSWLIAAKYRPPAWLATALLLLGLVGALYLPLMSSAATFLIPALYGPTSLLRVLLFHFRPGSFFAFQSIALAFVAAIALARSRRQP
jgi:hypothetical protein